MANSSCKHLRWRPIVQTRVLVGMIVQGHILSKAQTVAHGVYPRSLNRIVVFQKDYNVRLGPLLQRRALLPQGQQGCKGFASRPAVDGAHIGVRVAHVRASFAVCRVQNRNDLKICDTLGCCTHSLPQGFSRKSLRSRFGRRQVRIKAMEHKQPHHLLITFIPLYTATKRTL